MSNRIKIAISGKSGCGNSSVSRIVAERMGLKLINYTFHDMADEEGMEFEEFCRLAEQDSSYDKKLDRRQVELCREGDCVLGSRLAIWLIEDADLRVYLYASLKNRAQRIAEREGGSLEEKKQKTMRRDQRDHDRYLRLYGIDNDDYAFADLIIDTDELDQYQTAERIIDEVERKREVDGKPPL
jgi:cytidylate kinase